MLVDLTDRAKLEKPCLQLLVLKHQFVYSMNFSFRISRSIDHALACLTDKVISTLDGNRVDCCIFADLEKAFDTFTHSLIHSLTHSFTHSLIHSLTHSILLREIKYYEVRVAALQLFHSYLSNLLQVVGTTLPR